MVTVNTPNTLAATQKRRLRRRVVLGPRVAAKI